MKYMLVPQCVMVCDLKNQLLVMPKNKLLKLYFIIFDSVIVLNIVTIDNSVQLIFVSLLSRYNQNKVNRYLLFELGIVYFQTKKIIHQKAVVSLHNYVLYRFIQRIHGEHVRKVMNYFKIYKARG